MTEHHLLGITDGTCAAAPHERWSATSPAIIDAVQPDTIVTFGPDGMTGHEDHQTVSAWATAARAAPRPDARLLYATTTEEFVDVGAVTGPRSTCSSPTGCRCAPRVARSRSSCGSTPRPVDRKIVALRAQASQTTGLIEALGEERVREWWSTETFVEPTPPRARRAGLGHLAGGGMTSPRPTPVIADP